MTRCPALPSDPLPVPPSPRDARLKPVELQGKQVGARSFFSSSAETSKAAILALDDDGSLDGLDRVDEAARAGRYVRGKAKDFKNARAKAKGGSKSQLMSQAEKKAARASGDAQRASFSNSMQRRSMSIAKARVAQGISPTPTRRPTLSVNSFQDWPVPASRLSKASPPSSKA